jgi:hypothetical protein
MVVVVEAIFWSKMNTIGVMNSSCVNCGFVMMVP